MPKYDILMNIKTYKELSDWSMGEAILSRLFAEPKLKPEKIKSFFTEIEKGKLIDQVAECQPYWGLSIPMKAGDRKFECYNNLAWQRKHVAKSEGNIELPGFTSEGRHYNGGILYQSQHRAGIDWLSLFRDWCALLEPEGAILRANPDICIDRYQKEVFSTLDDRYYDNEIEVNAWSDFMIGRIVSRFSYGELNSSIQGLSNLGWASYIGGDYAQEVDHDAIKQAGFPIQKIGTGYLIQVTENFEDVTQNYAHFSAQRAKLKSLFREGLFLIPDEPYDHLDEIPNHR